MTRKPAKHPISTRRVRSLTVREAELKSQLEKLSAQQEIRRLRTRLRELRGRRRSQ